VFLWSLPGALVIVVVWAWLRYSGRKVRAQEHEAELKKLEAEVKERDAQRAKPAQRPTGARSTRPRR
jgi:cytochrome c-type biogenesis protein CcmH/NrfF